MCVSLHVICQTTESINTIVQGNGPVVKKILMASLVRSNFHLYFKHIFKHPIQCNNDVCPEVCISITYRHRCHRDRGLVAGRAIPPHTTAQSSEAMSINQINKKIIPHIDNKVERIQEEFMWERGKMKCNTHNILSPLINYS